MNKRVLILFSLLIVAVLPLPLLAQSSPVPVNGGFGGMSGWMRGSISAGGSYDGNNGHTTLGSYYGASSAKLLSSPFVLTASGAQLSFWVKKTGCVSSRIGIFDYNTSSQNELWYQNDCNTYGWTNYVYTLTQSLGDWLSIYIQDGGSPIIVDDFSVTNASNVGSTEWINGNFTGALGMYYWFQGDYCGVWVLDSGNGNPAPGLRGETGCVNSIMSVPFRASSSMWSVDSKCPSQVTTGKIYYSWGNTVNQVGTFSCDGAWHTSPITLTDWLGTTGSLIIGYTGSTSYSYFDNLCPSGGCLSGTPTPTASPYATATSGGGSYPTIDWSKFPTQAPYPTFPPFLTQVPYPTAIYGPGTAIPITGSVSITGSVRIDDHTPVAVKVDDSTPVAVKIDDRTPVRVMFGNGPNYTAVPWQNSGGEQRAPSSGSVLPTMITSPSQSSIQYGQGGSSTNPLNFHLEQVDYYFANVGIQPLGLSFNLLIHYYYPTAFSFAGIDILPGLYGLAAVYVLVTIIRQLQAR